MLLTEWNWDDAKEVWFEEGREEGLAEGREEGLAEGREEVQNLVLELMEQGYTAEQIKAKLAALNSGRAETAGN
jgi:flagellar biosynthesis/type III secretory pathway protein FliH